MSGAGELGIKNAGSAVSVLVGDLLFSPRSTLMTSTLLAGEFVDLERDAFEAAGEDGALALEWPSKAAVDKTSGFIRWCVSNNEPGTSLSSLSMSPYLSSAPSTPGLSSRFVYSTEVDPRESLFSLELREMTTVRGVTGLCE